MNYQKLKKKKCKICGAEFLPFKSTDMVCSFKCGEIYKQNHIKQNTPVKKVSETRKVENTKYAKLRKAFLALPENKYCKISKELFGTNTLATEIHHTYSGKDRQKYYLNISTWIAVSRRAHNWIHNNPKESYKRGWLKH